MQRYLNPTNDTAFKKVFSDAEVLKDFINVILDLPNGMRIKELEYIPLEQMPILHKGKTSIFDLKVKDERGYWYIVEMQKRHEHDYLKRMQYYNAHSYITQLKEGMPHSDLLPIVVISIMKTKLFDDTVPCISYHKVLETTTQKQYLFDMSYVFVELGKFNNKLDNIQGQWLHFFKCAVSETEPPKEITNDNVLNAYKTLEKYGWTNDEYDLYIRTRLQEEAEVSSLGKSFDEGVQEGREERNLEIARKMLSKGKTIEEIEEITGLTEEEIEEM